MAGRNRGAGWFLALLGAFALVLAACGSSSSPPATTKPATATTVNAAAAKASISKAYDTLFDFTNSSVSDKTAVIEDGASLERALTEALGSSLAKSATGANVVSVTLLSSAQCSEAAVAAPCAKVTYDLLGPNGTPLLSGHSTGYAIESDGSWLVAKSTICSLLTLFYSTEGKSGSPPGC